MSRSEEGTINSYSFYEFFAGGGMARLGLGNRWDCIFANDFSEDKCKSYSANFPDAKELKCCDINDISASELPLGGDLFWGSFPCQDLSLAGNGQGFDGDRSSNFWPFYQIIVETNERRSKPVPIIVVENVVGAITSNKGNDFSMLLSAFGKAGYVFGPVVVDAVQFVPQSRPRLFVIAVHSNYELDNALTTSEPNKSYSTKSLVKFYDRCSNDIKNNWIWWHLPGPQLRNFDLADIIENDPTGVSWDDQSKTNGLIDMMSERHLDKIRKAKMMKRKVVGTLYKRTRVDKVSGKKVQRAEVRFDGVSGCLRTPGGGSSRQTIIVVESEHVRSRLLSPREGARLMGLPDSYKLPSRYNEAYHLIGDGLVVPVISWLERNLLYPIMQKANQVEVDMPDYGFVDARQTVMGV